MGWLRNALVFPDNIWREAADVLGGEFVQGRWLANSEIKLSHRHFPMLLCVRFSRSSGSSDSNTQYTKVISAVPLRPEVKLVLMPKFKGLLGSIMGGLISRTGKTIDLPVLGDDYYVIGDNAELAERVFGQRDFLSALQCTHMEPTITLGGTLSNWLDDDDEEDDEERGVVLSAPRVLKDVHQLKALVDLTKVVLEVLEESDCIASGG